MQCEETWFARMSIKRRRGLRSLPSIIGWLILVWLLWGHCLRLPGFLKHFWFPDRKMLMFRHWFQWSMYTRVRKWSSGTRRFTVGITTVSVSSYILKSKPSQESNRLESWRSNIFGLCIGIVDVLRDRCLSKLWLSIRNEVANAHQNR